MTRRFKNSSAAPANTAAARELKGTKIDRVYIGSCTGGKTTDMSAAASLLVNKTVEIDTFVVPATTEVDRDLDEQKIDGKSLREIFQQAGAKIGRPSPQQSSEMLKTPQHFYVPSCRGSSD